MGKSYFLKILTAGIIYACAGAQASEIGQAGELEQASERDALLERNALNPIAIDISLPFEDDHVLQEISDTVPALPAVLHRMVRGYLRPHEDNEKLYQATLKSLSRHRIAQGIASVGLLGTAGQAITGLLASTSNPDLLADNVALSGLNCGLAGAFSTVTGCAIYTVRFILKDTISAYSDFFVADRVDKIKAEGALEIIRSFIPITIGGLTLFVAGVAQNSSENSLAPAIIFSTGGCIGVGTAVALLIRNWYKCWKTEKNLKNSYII